MSDDIRVSRDGGVIEILLDRASKKNALTNAMYGVFADALEEAERDPAVRAVLIRGAGDDFTAGNDLMDFAAVATGAAAGERHVWRVLKALAGASVPIVAAVQGRAVGIGTTLLLHCDLVFVAEDARLTAPFVDLALVPEAASSRLLPARIGHARAFAMFALGEALSGLEAAALGLANRAVPRAELEATARAACAALARRAPGAMRATKRLMRDPAALDAVIAEEGAEFDARLRSPEAAEAFAAFAEKRAPDFGRFG